MCNADAATGVPSADSYLTAGDGHRFTTMSNRSITLVGRASRLECHADHVSFMLTVNAKGDRPELKVECLAWYQRDIETFEAMDEGSLVGIIGHRPVRPVGPLPVLDIDRLELLGKPLQEVA